MNTYYIVVETNFYGPRLGFNANNLDEETFDNIFVVATDLYREFRENDDVPYETLYESVQLSEVSTIKPMATDIKW